MKKSKMNFESINLAERLLEARDALQETLQQEQVSLSPGAREKLGKWSGASRQVAEHLIDLGEKEIQTSLGAAKARLLAESQAKSSVVPTGPA